MTQPKWKRLWATENEQLFIDEAGVYAPELEVADLIEAQSSKNNRQRKYQLFRASLEKMKLSTFGKLVDANDHKPWFEDDDHEFLDCESGLGYCSKCGNYISNKLTEAAKCCGVDIKELREDFCSDNPSKLASAYRVIADNYGWVEFDQYPRILTEPEVDERWGSKDCTGIAEDEEEIEP